MPLFVAPAVDIAATADVTLGSFISAARPALPLGSPSLTASPLVFFITGVSSGFGRELVRECLARGDYVVATSRDPSGVERCAAEEEDRFLLLKMDVRLQSDVDDAFDAALHRFGTIDVVINNAGYGLIGEFESCSAAQLRALMDVNFFGALHVTRRALQVMRQLPPTDAVTTRRILQISSVAAHVALPMGAIYGASKAALEVFTECIAREVKPEWNISMASIEPGGFRTEWAGRNLNFAEEKVAAYDHLDGPSRMLQRHGTQPGDPIKAARAIWEIARWPDLPSRIPLGSDAYAVLAGRIKAFTAQLARSKIISHSTDLDQKIEGTRGWFVNAV